MRNANYKVIFNDPVDDLNIRTISSQLKWRCTGNGGSFLSNSMEYLVTYYPEDDYHYLLVDCSTQSGMKQIRCRSKIFPMEDGKIRPLCFFPNPDYKKKV